MKTSKTRKKTNNKINTADLWKQFDSEINNTKDSLICMYRENGNREKCDRCEF